MSAGVGREGEGGGGVHLDAVVASRNAGVGDDLHAAVTSAFHESKSGCGAPHIAGSGGGGDDGKLGWRSQGVVDVEGEG